MSRVRTTRVVEVGPDADPQRWLDANGQVDDDIDFAWKCERPVRLGLYQRPYKVLRNDGVVGVHVAWNAGGEWHVKVPCRNCWPCQLQRRREWIARAINEGTRSKRTWFFSGTFREKPETTDVVVAEYERYMKRLRHHNPGVRFRYLAVIERGERNGRLHVHMLLHCSEAVPWKRITGPWSAGFSKANWVRFNWTDGKLDEDTIKQVFYVAGYVTGDIAFKVRASLRYGKVPAAPTDKSEGARAPSAGGRCETIAPEAATTPARGAT